VTVGAAEQIIPSPQALCCHSNEAATAHTGYTEAGSPNETPCCKGMCVVGMCVHVCDKLTQENFCRNSAAE